MQVSEGINKALDYEESLESERIWPYLPPEIGLELSQLWHEKKADILSPEGIAKIHERLIYFIDHSDSCEPLTLHHLYLCLSAVHLSGHGSGMMIMKLLGDIDNIGPKRALSALIGSGHLKGHWGDNLTWIMEEPDDFFEKSNIGRLGNARWDRASIQSLRTWAAPWYPGPLTTPKSYLTDCVISTDELEPQLSQTLARSQSELESLFRN